VVKRTRPVLHEADPDANNNSDIFAVNLQGQTRQITATVGCEYEPAWSPDGKWIAYTATKRDVTTIDSVAEDTHVWITSASGDTRRELTASQDRRARNPHWRSDSRAIYFSANDHGQTLVFEVDLQTEKIRPLFGAIDEVKSQQNASEFKGALDSTAPTALDQHIQVTSFSVSETLVGRGALGVGVGEQVVEHLREDTAAREPVVVVPAVTAVPLRRT